MLSALSHHEDLVLAPRTKASRLRRMRRVGRWLLLTGWIILPLMPMLALGLSKLLGLEF